MLFHQTANSVGNYAYNTYFYDDVSYRPHFHRNFEVIYVLSGKVHCTAGDKSKVVSQGEFALVLPNEVHSLESVGSSRCWVGVFSGDYVHAFEKQTRDKTGSDFVFRCDDATLAYLREQLITEQIPSVFTLKSCLYALCDRYLNAVTLLPKKQKSQLLMQDITDYISKNYKNKIALSDMAEQLGYNYHYLSRCFGKIFEMSFTDFLNYYRLDCALNMLIETDKDITAVALESGFQSVRSFNDFFKSHIGTTPVKYRKGSR